ncbi:MAG: hypothetical protein IKK33_09800 [Lachnospiraceae bacterium]|nr:hypothetical protein [Lachnospiraceae bacterium]
METNNFREDGGVVKVEFMYSYVLDLVYHMLAHMPVNNPSNLYSEEYIVKIREAKSGQFENITEAMGQLAEYYNAHFDRLMMVNFLGFGCPDLNVLKYAMEQHPYFTAEDKECFVYPFLELLQKEALFYEAYWKDMYDRSEKERARLEAYLTKEWGKYKVLGSYFQKSRAIAGISYSITGNGRGLGYYDAFSAIVPFVEEEKEYKMTFLQLLHEYTHQFTDGMLQQNINMEDGSHTFSEYVVLLFDYYLIKALCPEDLEEYLYFLSPEAESGGPIMTEEILLSVFELPAQWHERLQQLVKDICALSI